MSYKQQMISIPQTYHESTSSASFGIISRPIDMKKHAQSNATLDRALVFLGAALVSLGGDLVMP